MAHSLSAIIIFTKDRPNILFKTLNSIKNVSVPVIVLDDSYLIRNRDINKRQIKKYSFVNYHGREEQRNVFKNSGTKEKILKEKILSYHRLTAM